MAWIELHQTLPTNKKTLRLKKLLKIKTPQAVGHLCMLWLWALDNAEDGDLSSFGADELAECAGWTGKRPEAFVEALAEAGFIDSGMRLHNWEDYAGRLTAKRQANAERMRRARARDRVSDDGDTDEHNDRTCDARDAHVQGLPYRTVPNRTVPIPTTPTPPAREGHSKVFTMFLDKVNAEPSSGCIAELQTFTDELGADVVCHALNIAIDERKTAWSYIRAILRAYVTDGCKTLEAVQQREAKRDGAKQATPACTPRSKYPPVTENVPTPDTIDELQNIYQSVLNTGRGPVKPCGG